MRWRSMGWGTGSWECQREASWAVMLAPALRKRARMAVVMSGPMAAGEDHHTAGVSDVFGCVCMRVWVHARACWLTGEGEFRSGHQSAAPRR